MSAISLTKVNMVILFALILALTGCDMRQYEQGEAEDILQTGREQMKDWMDLNCPRGKVISIENAVRKLPGGNEYLLPCVKGEISDGRKNRDFLLNQERNKVYLEPDIRDYRTFQRECLSYTLECLGMEGFSMEEPSLGEDYGENGVFFCISLITEMVEPDKEYGLTWGIDGYASSEYVKFPGELVLSGESIQDYIRNPDRGDIICAELNAQLQDDVTLVSYTTQQIEAIEEEYGLYFKKLNLETGSDGISIVWEDDERVVYYYQKED